MTIKKLTAAACALAAVLCVPDSRVTMRAASPYAISILDVPGSSLTAATGIDILGRVVGYFVDSSGTHGFLASNGSFTTISYPGAAWTAAYGVNTAGQVVGAFGSDATNGRHGFLLSGGKYSTFDVPLELVTYTE